jgi:hypothetical protein
VSITLTSAVLDVLDVLDVVGGGGGSDLPPVGISPAMSEVDNAHMSASAIANRFIGVAPFEILRKCQSVYIKKNGTITHDFLQGGIERINMRFAFAQVLATRKSQISCGRPLRSWLSLTLLRMSKPNSDAALH